MMQTVDAEPLRKILVLLTKRDALGKFQNRSTREWGNLYNERYSTTNGEDLISRILHRRIIRLDIWTADRLCVLIGWDLPLVYPEAMVMET